MQIPEVGDNEDGDREKAQEDTLGRHGGNQNLGSVDAVEVEAACLALDFGLNSTDREDRLD